MINNNNITVLVAEDDYLVSVVIEAHLKEIGFKLIGKAADGKEAVKMVCELRPDVVLMDIQMPKLGGLEAAKLIHKKCPTPVVVLTAHDSMQLVEKASKSGVAAYLIKPPQPEKIERAVIIAIANHANLMECRSISDELKSEINVRKQLEKMLIKEKERLVEINDQFVERELIMNELKEEINILLEKLNQPKKYDAF